MASIYWQILNQVSANVTNVFSNTTIRRKPIKLMTDTLPMVQICPGPSGEQIPVRGQQFNKGVWWDYPVLVVYVEAANRQVTAGLQAWLDQREIIRNVLFQPVLGTPVNQFDVLIDSRDAIDFSAYFTADYDVTGWLVTYRSAEQRIS